MTDVALPPPSPRDRQIQDVALKLVEAYMFREARDVLNARLKEIADERRSCAEQIYIEWLAIRESERPDFLTFAHHRRHHELGTQ